MTQLLDIHHHIGPRDRLEGRRQGDYDFGAAVDRHLRVMDEYDLEQACLIASHNAAFSRPDDVRWLNENVAKACSARPDRFVAGVGTVDPAIAEDGMEEIRYCIEDLGLRAMAWHARFSGVFTDCPAIMEYVGQTASLGVAVMIHMIAESSLEAPWRVVKIAEQHPDAQIVALDAFTSSDQSKWIVEKGGEVENLTFDLSLIRTGSGSVLEAFVARHGAKRLVFGSDYYESYRTRCPGAIYEVRSMDVDEEARDDILGGNARRILGISEK